MSSVDGLSNAGIPNANHPPLRQAARSTHLSLVFALTALIFYIPANLLPFMSIELYGRRNTSTIFGGVVTLFEDGSWLIAVIVFLASLLIPFIKLLMLFYLSLSSSHDDSSQLKKNLHRFLEAIGRWAMLDVFLLAILVGIMKLGTWTEVQPEAGSFLFALVVIFTMLSSAFFEPQPSRSAANEKTQ